MKNQEEVNKKHDLTPKYRLDELYKLSNGDKNFVKEMIELFIKSTREGVASISEALKVKSSEKIADYAHKLASPCTHLEALSLKKILEELEKKSRKEFNEEELKSLFIALESETKTIFDLLRADLKNFA